MRTVETTGVIVLRAIEEEGVRGRSSEIKVSVPTEIALYILNTKRAMLAAIEKRHNMQVFLHANDQLLKPHYTIEVVRAAGASPVERPMQRSAPVQTVDISDLPDVEDNERADGPIVNFAGDDDERGEEKPQRQERGQRHAEGHSGQRGGGEKDADGRKRRRGRRGGRNRGKGRGRDGRPQSGGQVPAGVEGGQQEMNMAVQDGDRASAPAPTQAPREPREPRERRERKSAPANTEAAPARAESGSASHEQLQSSQEGERHGQGRRGWWKRLTEKGANEAQ